VPGCDHGSRLGATLEAADLTSPWSEVMVVTSKPVRCRLGLHAYVRRHPVDERSEGPDHQVCQMCGKQRGPAPDVPPGFLGGG
jgi:hypothetical protein